MQGVMTSTDRSIPTGTGAVPPSARNATIRLWVWAAWALVVLGVYYAQLWNAPWAGQPPFEYGGSLTAMKLSAVLAAGTSAAAAAALLAGAALESFFGWPRLPFAWALLRRLTAGALGILIVLGPLHAAAGAVVQTVAGAFLPFAGEAVSRGLSGLFGALFVTGAALPAGQVACGWLGWRPESWRTALLYYAAIGFGLIAAGCGLLALAGLFRPRPIQVLVMAMLVAGLPRLWSMIRRAGWWTVDERPVDRRWFRRGLQIVSAAALAAAFLTALAPETEYDSLWYHLGLPKIWLEAGHPVDVVHDYVSLYPLQWELVFTAGLVLGGPVSAKLLHFICLPLGALLVWELSRSLAPRAQPWLAVALFLTIPTVLWEATTAYVDLAVALHIGLGVLALLRWTDSGDRRWFALAIVTLGLAMAIKHLALVAVAILAPGLALWLWRRQGWPLVRAVVPAAVLVALALLIPLPWYARAWFASGNPFFPELFGLFGASPPERWDHLAQQGLAGFKARFGIERTPMNLLALPWDMTMHAARYGGTLGPLFLLLLPALALFRGRTARLAWMGWFVVLFLVVWASPISSFQLRFLVVVSPVLAILAAEAVSRLTAVAPPAGGKVLAAGLLALLVLNLPPFTRFHERDRAGWEGWLTHVIHVLPLEVVLGRQSQDEYLARHIPTYSAWQFLHRTSGEDARVMTFRGGDHYYTGRQRIASVSPMARAAAWQPPGEEAIAWQELRALGVTHLVVDRRSLESPGTALLSERMRADYLDLLYEDPGALVFHVTAASGSGSPGSSNGSGLARADGRP
jgi:4-amino-4-deoxy-L-arabinose transferase-like glycosyltransferase